MFLKISQCPHLIAKTNSQTSARPVPPLTFSEVSHYSRENLALCVVTVTLLCPHWSSKRNDLKWLENQMIWGILTLGA